MSVRPELWMFRQMFSKEMPPWFSGREGSPREYILVISQDDRLSILDLICLVEVVLIVVPLTMFAVGNLFLATLICPPVSKWEVHTYSGMVVRNCFHRWISIGLRSGGATISEIIEAFLAFPSPCNTEVWTAASTFIVDDMFGVI